MTACSRFPGAAARWARCASDRGDASLRWYIGREWRIGLRRGRGRGAACRRVLEVMRAGVGALRFGVGARTAWGRRGGRAGRNRRGGLR